MFSIVDFRRQGALDALCKLGFAPQQPMANPGAQVAPPQQMASPGAQDAPPKNKSLSAPMGALAGATGGGIAGALGNKRFKALGGIAGAIGGGLIGYAIHNR